MSKIDDDLLYKLIGERIRESRYNDDNKKPRITQSELAKKTGVTRTSITNIEQGNQKLPVHLLYEICAHLDLKIEDMLPPIKELMDDPSLSWESLDDQLSMKKERVEGQIRSFVTKRMK